MNGDDQSGAAKRLRDALQREKHADDVAAREKQRLDEERVKYEQERKRMLAQTCRIAQEALEAMRDSPTERIQVEPQPPGFLARRISPAREVDGWTVTLDNGKVRVLCPDGVLISPPPRGRIEARHYTSLNGWIERKVADVEAPAHIEYGSTRFKEAFDPSTHPQRQERTSAQDALRSRLRTVEDEVTRILARILHERGVSI